MRGALSTRRSRFALSSLEVKSVCIQASPGISAFCVQCLYFSALYMRAHFELFRIQFHIHIGMAFKWDTI